MFILFHFFKLRVEANVIPFLCWIVSASLSVFCAISTFSAFIVVTEAKSEKQGEMMFRMKIASVIANAGVMFFLYCHGAEVTMHVHEDIHDALYGTPWYSQSIRFKKLLISFMIQIQKALQISAFGMYKLNLNFFMTVCRTIYSALNMLLMAFTDIRRM
ncbi:uncharacterized protein LOC135847538 [Planococcus citri]|uniref:uncharacterized protein LOC135847538 n=1 Tax=Planococcus citri TaxID=170843 RepID=UPI0031F72D79